VRAYLGELQRRNLEYTEIYATADDISQQVALEALGFTPTGLLPQWYAPGCETHQDSLVYTISFSSSLPDCPIALTAKGEILRQRLLAAGINLGVAGNAKEFLNLPCPDVVGEMKMRE
jgi:hypothetical protein